MNGGGTVYGGGIFNSGGAVTLDDSTVSGNEASGNGGGIYSFNRGTVTLDGSTVSHNTADADGGILSSGTVTMYDSSTVTGNEASYGGGIDNSGTVTMNPGSTITGNEASVRGGGVYNIGGRLVDAVAGENVRDNIPNDIYNVS